MTTYYPSVKDMKFVLNDVLRVDQYLELPRFENIDASFVSSVIDGFGSFAAKEIVPLNATGDREGAKLGQNGVVSSPGLFDAYRRYVEGGWPPLACNGHDSSALPGIIYTSIQEMLSASNLSFSMVISMTPGAYQVISRSAPDELKDLYLPRIISGEWTAAMSLTEPQCGSALEFVRTKAEKQADGSFRITGTKMFNSWADHDLSSNIVHLVLAREPDAPKGIKGLSLFLVPKFIVGADGELGERNQFFVASLEEKLGIHASPTCLTNFDGATGYLLGEPNRGLASMFVIMNFMRLATGAGAVGLADAAYQNALAYTRERIAGRSVAGAKYPDLAGDPIVVHPDVRRMLMTMRAIVESGRALCSWVSLNADLGEVHTDHDQRQKHGELVSLLTPIVKSFLADKGFECTDLAIQCFGGHGYIRDSGAEQYMRDARMLRVAEGTSGIQALDFAGRKVTADGAATLTRYFSLIRETLDATTAPAIAEDVKAALDLTEHLVAEQLPRWKADPEVMAAVSLDFLNIIGWVSLGFMWTKLAQTAEHGLQDASADKVFLQNKLHTASFFCTYLLPEVHMLAARVRAGASAIMAIHENDL